MPPTQTTAPSMCSAKARAAMSGLPRSGDDRTILFGIPRMNPELAWMVAIFWIGRKPRCEVSMASASQTVRTALEGVCTENSDSDVLMMQSADHGMRHDVSGPLNRAGGWRILVQ